MEWCPKYKIKVTGCSKQVGLFVPELCEKCLEEKIRVVDPRKGELVLRWREKLGIEAGMSKEEALRRFRDWRATKKTCERCEEKDLSEFCPFHLICEEAEEVIEDVVRDDNGARVNEADEFETIRAEILKGRKRDAFRPTE